MTVQTDSAHSEEFARLTDPFRPELLAHCYRMLGSLDDAEDSVQETMLRAWRAFDQFEGRASVRTWLYKIATNVCLRALENRPRRPLPTGLGQPSGDPEGPLSAPMPEVPWLQPLPDALLRPAARAGTPASDGAGEFGDPASVAASRAGVRLALIAALQYLPARQRAVLIMRDVLGWRATEVAAMLGTTTVAVNSALLRARATLAQVAPAQDDIREPAAPADLALVNRYAAAFENADAAALAELLREDAVFEMPPLPVWFSGREAIRAFITARIFARQPGGFTMLPTVANGQPALFAYLAGPDGKRRAYGVQVLTFDGPLITRMTAFLDPGLAPAFGFPAQLD